MQLYFIFDGISEERFPAVYSLARVAVENQDQLVIAKI